MNKLKIFKEKLASILQKKDEAIATLTKENEKLKQEPRTNLTLNVEEMKFPKNITVDPVEVKNWPEQKDFFDSKKIKQLAKEIGDQFPEIPKEIIVKNLEEILKGEVTVKGKVEVINLPDKDYMPKWMPDFAGTFLKALITGIDKITNKVFSVRLSPDERKKPLFVIPIDQYGRPIDFNQEVKIYQSAGMSGGSGGGSGGGTAESVKIKNVAGTEINPASEENQDQMISLLGDVITALSNIEIDAESVNLNTDQLEALITETNQNIKDTLEHYKVSDIDDASTTKYYGFLDKAGNWYIMRENTTANTYRYFAGSTNYATNWTNRASLSYDYFSSIF